MNRNSPVLPPASRKLPTLWVGTCAVALVIGLPGCSKESEAPSKATQVAAKVGDSEISVHQINHILGRSPMESPTQEALQAASKRVLERLIDQQLAVDAATEAKLHRTPEVIAALEAARQEVLARAYMQSIAAHVAKPTPEEAARYYQENPALFAQRRLFNLEELRVPDASEVLPELRTLVEQGKSAAEIAQWLSSKKVRFSGNNTSRSAEQIPMDLLSKISALQDGQGQVFESGSGATVIRVAGSKQVPISEQDALPVIEKFLQNKRVNEELGQEMRRLREATPIVYLGEFSTPSSATAATPTTGIELPTPGAPHVDPNTLQPSVKVLK